jgi:hypothetical protein
MERQSVERKPKPRLDVHAPGASEKKRVKNDGRPPDTIKDLVLAAPTKKQKKEVSDLKQKRKVPSIPRIPSYPWQKNSCWLDTSLELLHATVSYNFGEFTVPSACMRACVARIYKPVYVCARKHTAYL